MERLTKRNEDGSVSSTINCPNGCKYFTCSIEEGQHCSHECEADYMCKLAEYEDLEEQGLLFRLPCKAGSTIYKLYKMPTKCTAYGEYKDEYACCGCEELECDSSYEWEIFKCITNIEQVVNISDKIGKTAFLTREEAEQKLKELTK